MSKNANAKNMELIRVSQVYFNQKAGTYESGIVLLLQDGTWIKHCQDGYVSPQSKIEVTSEDMVQFEFEDSYEKEQALKSAIANQIGMVCHPDHLRKTRSLIDKLEVTMKSRHVSNKAGDA